MLKPTNTNKKNLSSPVTRKTFHRSFKQKFLNYTGETVHSLEIIFRLKGSLLRGTWRWIIVCAAYGFLITLAHQLGWLSKINLIYSFPRIALTLNFVVALLLAFRTNTAHNRFWEGRKLWGAMVNVVRNLARGIWVIVEERSPTDREEKRSATQLVPAFAVAMKYHLRSERVNCELMPLMSQWQYQRLQEVEHAPLEIAFWLADYLQLQYNQNKINVFQLNTLQADIDELVDILGGCERILKTPMPIIYTIVLKIILIVDFLVLPFELIQGIGWWTGPAMAFISLIILSINEIGAEIEEPFGRDLNDLPLDLISKTIVRNIEHLLTLEPVQSRWREQKELILNNRDLSDSASI